MITPTVISAFERALTKVAFTAEGKLLSRAVGTAVPEVAQGAKRLWSAVRSPMAARTAAGTMGGAGAGAVGGAAIGGGVGTLQGYRDTRAQGGSVASAAQAGLLGGLQGAVRGGQRGLALGAVAGGVGSAAAPSLPAAMARLPVVGSGARFGQRQLHGLTGWTPAEGIRSIGGGAANAQRGVEEAANKLRSVRAAGKDAAGAERNVTTAVKGLEAATTAEEKGLTSLPGYAKALRSDPVGALRAGLNEQWAGQSRAGKALTIGATGVGLASEVANREGNTGVGESLGKAVGGSLPWMMGPLPASAALALTPALAFAGGLAGKGVDVLRGKPNVGRPTAPGPNDIPDGPGESVERVYSDRASGVAPEGIN
jgi:hypothetical protein